MTGFPPPDSLLITKGTTAQERWSDENVQNVVELWHLSAEDARKFRTLGQERLQDIEHWKNDPYEVMRYYKEFKGDLKKVEKMVRAMIQWRLDHNIDHVLSTYGTPHPLFHYLPIALLEGTDKEGDPIYLDRMGEADSWGLLKHFGMEEMINYFVYFNEYINSRDTWRYYEQRAGRRVRNFSVVIDLHGLNAGHMRPGLLPLLNKVANITQPYYAGWAKRIFLLRAPSIFKFIWSLSKHFFEPHIRDMIIMTSHADYLDVLQEHIELEKLPDCVAPGIGKGKAMPGYFENIHLEGGPIPDPDEFEAQSKIMSLDRQETALSTTSVSTSASDVSVSGKLIMKGYWDDQKPTGSIVTAFDFSSNSLSTLDE